MALCGVSDVAIHKLRALAKIHGSVSDSEELSSLERGLGALGDANAWLALSFVAWRGKERNAKLAVHACTKAAEIVLCSELSDAPLPAFHTAALCFTALWDPIRDADTPCIEDPKEQQMIEHLLKRLVSVVRSFAVVYKVCRPHALYCVALRTMILRKMEYDASVLAYAAAEAEDAATPRNGDDLNANANLVPIPSEPTQLMGMATAEFVNRATASERPHGSGSLMSRCLPFGVRGRDLEDPFAECARFANTAMQYWVEGLARLEMDDKDSWWYARDLFHQYAHAEYEVLRCEQQLANAGFTIPEDGEEGDPNDGAPV
jgi:hypothetical protein